MQLVRSVLTVRGVLKNLLRDFFLHVNWVDALKKMRLDVRLEERVMKSVQMREVAFNGEMFLVVPECCVWQE